MTGAVPIAFYAPLKSPDHPGPSGERTMARLLLRALAAAGFAPVVASRLRTFDRGGEPIMQAALRASALAEAEALIARYGGQGPEERPRLWFTYHVYYKAPDWIGPRVAERLGIPYAVAEGSRASKRAAGAWAIGHAGAEAALDAADVVFAVTAVDREALERARPAHQRLVDLPPFVDLDEWPALDRHARDGERGPVRLLAVAMMREGDKLASYALLARALGRLAPKRSWRLDIVGDGPARSEVERLFAGFGARVRFLGSILRRAELADLYASADLFVWPAVNEAYGMVFLEAQSFGCPVVAGAHGGVGSVVRCGETGILTEPGDADAFARAVTALIDDPVQRRALGDRARRFVLAERGLPPAAERLRSILMPLVERRGAA